jgi:hypothetical protein
MKDDSAELIEKMLYALDDVAYHRRELMQLPLYQPQIEAVELVEKHIRERTGEIITIRSSRQTMKNECAATIQHRALTRYQHQLDAVYLRFAPTWKPQIVNSKLRLERYMIADPLIPPRKSAQSKGGSIGWYTREGYIYQLGYAQVQFLSAQKDAQVVGGTASICLDVDEAHKIDKGKFGEDLNPMRAFYNVPCILWGVAADGLDLLQEFVDFNIKRGREDLNLTYPATIWCNLREEYDAHWRQTVGKYGIDHPFILTQYLLKSIAAVDLFFNQRQINSLFSSGFGRLRYPSSYKNPLIVIDIAGEDFEDEVLKKTLHKPEHDSTAIMVGDVDYNNVRYGMPLVRIGDIYHWVGKPLTEQQELITKLLTRFPGAMVLIDGRGLGHQIAGHIKRNFKNVRVYMASDNSVSEDCYRTLAWVNNDRIKIFANDQSPEYQALLAQCGTCKYEIKNHEKMKLLKASNSDKIDFVKAITYITRRIPVSDADTLVVPA